MDEQFSYSIEEEFDNTVKRYEQYLKGEKSGYFDVEELEEIVDYYLYQGKPRASKKALDFGLRLHPGNTSLRAKRAKICLATGHVKKAYNILESLGQMSDYESDILKIETLIRLERHGEAFEKAEKIIAEECDYLDDICFDVAMAFFCQLDFETALHFLLIGDEFNNKNIDLLFEIAFCYEQMDKTDKAIETYNRIIDIDSYIAEAWFNLGQVYFINQDFNKAIDAYDFTLAIRENDELAYLQKAHALFHLDRFNEALAIYADCEHNSLKKWQSMLFTAECYEKMEQYNVAIDYYKKSLSLRPKKNYDALTGIAVCLLELENYPLSIAFTLKAIAVNSNAPDAWVYLAEGLLGVEEEELALNAYLKSLSIEPNQPDTLVSIAHLYMDMNDAESALEYYRAAFLLDETIENIDVYIAAAYFKLKEYGFAGELLFLAIARDPGMLDLFYEICPEAVEMPEFLPQE